MKIFQRILLILAVLAVGGVALGVRLRAVDMLPVDYDEDDYLGAGQRYAQAIRAGDLQAIIDYRYNYEHPPLTKIVYALTMLPLPEAPLIPELSSTAAPVRNLPSPHFERARLSSAAFGTLEAMALAVVNPLAGLLLGLHTWTIKYTSQIMLEPLPALASLLAVLFYAQYSEATGLRKAGRRGWAWLLLSALALGVTAASKYPYCMAGVAILVDWLWNRRPWAEESERALALRGWLLPVLAWGLVAVAVFVALNPRLWADPIARLQESLFYHGGYAQSAHVQRAGFPPWQPLVWLMGPVPWHPGVFVVALDVYISVLAALGFGRLWQRRRVFALWLLIALVFLLFWPTKWPQYILILTAPLSLAAAEGVMLTVGEPLAGWLRRRRESRAAAPVSLAARADARLQGRLSRRDLRRALPWLVPGLLALGLIAIFPLIYQAAMAVTDFNAISIRDGIQGGVWRAAWSGLTGQEEPVGIDLGQGSRSKEVHYAGPRVLLQLLFGAAPELLVFNIMWTGLSVALQTGLGLAAALLLHRRGLCFRTAWRSILILPWAIPEFVGALVWLRIFEPRYGWLVLAQNVPKDVNLPSWFENPAQTLVILLIAATWYGFPFVMLAASAGLKLVPEEVYDAAAIDGAGGWRLFRYITWPLLLPLVTPAVIIRSIFAFNQFYLFYTLRTNFPMLTFASVSYYFFTPSGPFGGQFAVSAAINIFTVLVLVALILWFDRVSRAAEGVTYA